MTDLPLMFEVDEVVAYFAERGDPTRDEISWAASRLGRNNYPTLIADLWGEGLLLDDVAAWVVPDAWSDAEFPMLALDRETWRTLFEWAGFTVDGVRAPRPAEPLVLWRGALPDYRSGWSWTGRRELAQWFADRPHNRGEARVWRAVVHPERLLARIAGGRGEDEWVVDTDGLDVLADSLPTGRTSS